MNAINLSGLAMLALMGLCLPKLNRCLRLTLWRKSLGLDKHKRTFDSLYQGVDGYALSREARRDKDAFDYVYGEIKFMPFVALLSTLSLSRETVFFDLGSGTGKAVIACALVFQVKQCVGVELFSELHQAAVKVKETLEAMPCSIGRGRTVDFRNQDFLEADFHDATLIFINATAYFAETWERLNNKFDELTTEATIITTSKPLLSLHYEVKRTVQVTMSWGSVTAYIHQRK